MHPSPASDSSSQCSAKVAPIPRAYCIALSISPASCTPVPSSVKTLTPRAAISASGASSVPCRPTVIAPATATSIAAARPRSSTWATTAAESVAGMVLGIANSAV